MAYADEFLRAHWPTVASVVVVLLTTITAFHILGLTFPAPGSDDYISKVVTIETFSKDEPKKLPDKRGLEEGACNRYGSHPHQMEKYCSKLRDRGCATMKCDNGLGCVWLEPQSKCVAGDREGPTFHTHQGVPVNVKCWRWGHQKLSLIHI